MDILGLIGLVASLMTIIGIPGIVQLRKFNIDSDLRNQLIGMDLDFGVFFWKMIKILVWFLIFYFIYEGSFSYNIELIEKGHVSYVRDAIINGLFSGGFCIIIFTSYILFSINKLVFWEIICYLLMASIFLYYASFLVFFGCCDQTNGIVPFVLSSIFALLLSKFLYEKKVTLLQKEEVV